MRGRALAFVLAAVALGLGGCGSAERPGQRIRGRTLTIYFSGPLQGASSLGASAALNGARIALAGTHARIGSYRIVLKALDDATPTSDGWDPNQTTVNVRLAAQDPTTVGYLGDFNSGASAISIPVLNRAGIPQISPGSTAVGLTTTGPGAAPGEPEKYYPTGTRTFVRMVPDDASQALALVQVGRATGCHSIVVLHDGEVDGEDTALTFALTAQSAGLRVLAVQAFQRQAVSYSSLATSVGASGADCVVISAIDEASSVLLTQQVARALPKATIFAANGLADDAYIDPSGGGIPESLDPRLIVVSATLPARQYSASASRFDSDYERRFGALQPPAIFGYEAAELMLGAIARATDGGRKQADRARVLAELFATRHRNTVLGSFRINRSGNSTIARFGIYRVVSGRLAFVGAAP